MVLCFILASSKPTTISIGESILSQKAALVDLVFEPTPGDRGEAQPGNIGTKSDGPALVAGRREYVENHR